MEFNLQLAKELIQKHKLLEQSSFTESRIIAALEEYHKLIDKTFKRSYTLDDLVKYIGKEIKIEIRNVVKQEIETYIGVLTESDILEIKDSFYLVISPLMHVHIDKNNVNHILSIEEIENKGIEINPVWIDMDEAGNIEERKTFKNSFGIHLALDEYEKNQYQDFIRKRIELLQKVIEISKEKVVSVERIRKCKIEINGLQELSDDIFTDFSQVKTDSFLVGTIFENIDTEGFYHIVAKREQDKTQTNHPKYIVDVANIQTGQIVSKNSLIKSIDHGEELTISENDMVLMLGYDFYSQYIVKVNAKVEVKKA